MQILTRTCGPRRSQFDSCVDAQRRGMKIGHVWVGFDEPGLILEGMRGFLCRGGLGLLIGVTFGLSDPGRGALSAEQQGAQETQQLLENTARTKAEELGASVKGTALGFLGPDASRTITRWDLTVRQWKREKGAGAAPLLAEGVLFDCLGRLQGVRTPQLSSELPRPVFVDLRRRPSGPGGEGV